MISNAWQSSSSLHRVAVSRDDKLLYASPSPHLLLPPRLAILLAVDKFTGFSYRLVSQAVNIATSFVPSRFPTCLDGVESSNLYINSARERGTASRSRSVAPRATCDLRLVSLLMISLRGFALALFCARRLPPSVQGAILTCEQQFTRVSVGT